MTVPRSYAASRKAEAAAGSVISSKGSVMSQGVCCTIDYGKIKKHMDRWRDAIETGDLPEGIASVSTDGGTIAPIQVVCRKVDESIEEAIVPRLPGVVIRCDEPSEPILYGKGTAPTPLEFFLAGIGMCMASIYGEGAADLGVSIDSVEIHVRGDLDMIGTLDFEGKGYESRPGFAKIRYTVKIESAEPEAKIRALVDRVERTCPAHNTVVHGTEGDFIYFLNGKEVSGTDS
jgi:uncharacterized OsmC-like protein